MIVDGLSKLFAGKAACGFCLKPMRRQSALNDPSFCSYAHAVAGQPEHAKATQRNTGGTQFDDKPGAA